MDLFWVLNPSGQQGGPTCAFSVASLLQRRDENSGNEWRRDNRRGAREAYPLPARLFHQEKMPLPFATVCVTLTLRSAAVLDVVKAILSDAILKLRHPQTGRNLTEEGLGLACHDCRKGTNVWPPQCRTDKESWEAKKVLLAPCEKDLWQSFAEPTTCCSCPAKATARVGRGWILNILRTERPNEQTRLIFKRLSRKI